MSAMPMERHELDDEEAAALEVLAARIRELCEAAVVTGTGAGEAAAVAAEVEALTARLAGRRHPAPPYAVSGNGVMDRATANPVTGALNPLAPPVRLTTGPDGVVRGEYTLGHLYEGPPTYVHGGVSAMVLDQALGMAAVINGTPGMTATLDMRYRRPTPLGVPLSVEAKANRVEGRKVYASGTITGPDGRVTVEASAMFIMPTHFVPAGN